MIPRLCRAGIRQRHANTFAISRLLSSKALLESANSSWSKPRKFALGVFKVGRPIMLYDNMEFMSSSPTSFSRCIFLQPMLHVPRWYVVASYTLLLLKHNR